MPLFQARFWIAACAPLFIWVAGAGADDGIDLEKGREFWAFRKPAKSEPPTVQDAEWSQSPIDRFVRAKLAEAPQELDKLRLVRRVYFDLHGLPPS